MTDEPVSLMVRALQGSECATPQGMRRVSSELLLSTHGAAYFVGKGEFGNELPTQRSDGLFEVRITHPSTFEEEVRKFLGKFALEVIES